MNDSTADVAAPDPDLVQLASKASSWFDRVVPSWIVQTSWVVVLLATLWTGYHLYRYRNTVQVLPLAGAGGDQIAVALQVSELLAAITVGAGSGIDADECLEQATSEPPPSVVIPGTGIPLANVIDYLERSPLGRQDRVHVALVSTDATHHRLRVQFDGYHVSGRTFTGNEKPTISEALVDGAEKIFAILRPTGAAYYFATRDPTRSLELVEQTVREKEAASRRLAAANRVWAIVLRDQGDQLGARAKLWDAFTNATDDDQKAKILVDTGYTHGIAGEWPNAVSAFTQALKLAPGSAIAESRLGTALIELGDIYGAEEAFLQAIANEPHWAEPWRGRAQVALRRWDIWTARDHYRSARRESFSAADRAQADRELADVYAENGCLREAKALYQQAAQISGCRAAPGLGGVCRGVVGDVAEACMLPVLTVPIPG